MELAGAQHQYPLVAQLKILDHRQSGIGFAQTDAIRQDAAVVISQLVNHAHGAILLELIESVPHLAVLEACGCSTVVPSLTCCYFLVENFVEGFVINRFRGVVVANVCQGVQHLLLHVPGAPVVCPKPVEPLPQFVHRLLVFGGQVDFQVGLVAFPEATPSKIGTAHHPRLAMGRGGEVHLAVEKIGAADGADLHSVLAHPLGTPPGKGLLRQHVPGFQATLAECKRLGLLLSRIQVLHRTRRAKQKPGAAHALQLVCQEGITVDGEVGRYEVEVVCPGQGLPQIADHRSRPVVQDVAGCTVKLRHSPLLLRSSGQESGLGLHGPEDIEKAVGAGRGEAGLKARFLDERRAHGHQRLGFQALRSLDQQGQ